MKRLLCYVIIAVIVSFILSELLTTPNGTQAREATYQEAPSSAPSSDHSSTSALLMLWPGLVGTAAYLFFRDKDTDGRKRSRRIAENALGHT
jgi:hypothetical protein